MPAAPANAPTGEPAYRREKDRHELEPDHPLNRSFGDREQKADTGENLKFDFSDERNEIGDAAAEHELERPEPDDGGWQVGDVPDEFESPPVRQAPTMMGEPEPAARPAPTPVRRVAAAAARAGAAIRRAAGGGESRGVPIG